MPMIKIIVTFKVLTYYSPKPVSGKGNKCFFKTLNSFKCMIFETPFPNLSAVRLLSAFNLSEIRP